MNYNSRSPSYIYIFKSPPNKLSCKELVKINLFSLRLRVYPPKCNQKHRNKVPL